MPVANYLYKFTVCNLFILFSLAFGRSETIFIYYDYVDHYIFDLSKIINFQFYS